MAANGFLCGWYGPSNFSLDSQLVLKKMGEYFPQRDASVSINDTDLKMLATGDTSILANEIEISIFGVPYWKDDELNEHSKTYGVAATCGRLYQEKGIELLSLLAGKFVLTINDKKQKKFIIALDRIGQQHCFFSHVGENLVFASRADAVAEHPKVLGKISNQGVFNYVYFHSEPSPASIYKNISKLEGGQYLVFQLGRVTLKRYWNPEFFERNEESISSLGAEMCQIIEKSVTRFADSGSVGAFLSGGLDSSTVSGMLAKVQKDKVKTFTIGFNAEGYDETEYARLASKHFSTEQNEYYVTPRDVVDLVPKIATFFDEPFGNSSALPAYLCARMAKEKGITRLLAGDGGDEFFAGNERYAKQLIFEQYQKVPKLLRSMLLEPMLFSNSIASNLPGIKKASSYIAQARTPLPDRLESYNFLHRHAASELFTPDFLREVNILEPIEILRESYNIPDECTSLNKMMWLDWKRTLHDNDLVKVNRMCELAGIEVVYPLLDDELIEFSCRIPSNIKLKDGKLRWFYKEAIKSFLPDEIINKKKQGFGLPFGVWTSEYRDLQEMAYSELRSLKQRNIFRDEFIDKTIKMHKSVHAKFYGELVWILMMLELWLKNK